MLNCQYLMGQILPPPLEITRLLLLAASHWHCQAHVEPFRFLKGCVYSCLAWHQKSE